MKKKLGVLLMLSLLLSCSPGKAKSEQGSKPISEKFPIEYLNPADIQEDGVYKMAFITSSPFKGIFSPIHTADANDSSLYALMSSSLFGYNEDFERVGTDDGLAKYEIDKEKKQVIITLREGLKWSDGHPMSVDDIIYALEVLCHPDYTGPVFNKAEMSKIVGVKEFNEGKAKTISGLIKESPTKLIIQATELSPKLINSGSFLLGVNILPKHYLSDVPMKDLETSDKIRKHPLSCGEFVLTKLIPGESLELVPNKYYYKGATKLSKLIVQTIAPQFVIESMKKGEYHAYNGVPTDLYNKYKELSNIVLLGKPSLSYSYIGFNLGHYDKNKGENVQDRDTPLQDVRIRKAIAHAINVDEIASAFYNGLRVRATTITPPVFKKYFDKEQQGYPYSPEKAKELLKEAGYTDTNGDGIVDKDGKNLKIKFAFTQGGDTAEPLSQAIMQYIKEVGIDVELTTGRLMEMQLFFDKIEANDNEIDMYIAGWSVGTSLDPSQTTSRRSQLNYQRYVDEENDKLLAAIDDLKGFEDPEYRSKAYIEWERHYMDQAITVPLMFNYSVIPYNKAIKHIKIMGASKDLIHNSHVVSEPLQAK